VSGNESFWGAESVDKRLLDLLVLSQVILSFQLPFAIIPLVQFTSDRRQMGVLANGFGTKVMAWACAAVVVGLNIVLIYLQIGRWADALEEAATSATWVYATTIPVSIALACFLIWLVVYPYLSRREERMPVTAAPLLPGIHFHRIGVAVEFGGGDDNVLAQAAALARAHDAQLVAVHVVEGLGAEYYGAQADDQESRADRTRMQQLVEHLRNENLPADGVLGFGDPAQELVRIAHEQHLDLLVLGTHGHRFLADLALGQTVSPVLHRLKIPVLVVPNRDNPVPA